MMKNSYSSYIRQVDRALDLPRHRKKELLRGFQTELKERFPGNPSEETLLIDLGPPEDVAYALFDAVDAEEHTHFNSIRFRWFQCAIVVLALLVIIAVGVIIHSYSTELKRVEIITVQDPVPTQYSVDAGSK